MSARRVLGSRFGIVAALATAFVLGGVTVGAVQLAGASGSAEFPLAGAFDFGFV